MFCHICSCCTVSKGPEVRPTKLNRCVTNKLILVPIDLRRQDHCQARSELRNICRHCHRSPCAHSEAGARQAAFAGRLLLAGYGQRRPARSRAVLMCVRARSAMAGTLQQCMCSLGAETRPGFLAGATARPDLGKLLDRKWYLDDPVVPKVSVEASRF